MPRRRQRRSASHRELLALRPAASHLLFWPAHFLSRCVGSQAWSFRVRLGGRGICIFFRFSVAQEAPLFCPSCKLEYRPGFTHCNDCDVDLVDALPQVDAAPGIGCPDLCAPDSASGSETMARESDSVKRALNDAGVNSIRGTVCLGGLIRTQSYEAWVDGRPARAALRNCLRSGNREIERRLTTHRRVFWAATTATCSNSSAQHCDAPTRLLQRRASDARLISASLPNLYEVWVSIRLLPPETLGPPRRSGA